MKGESKYYVSLAHTRADIDHTIAAWTERSRSSRASMAPTSPWNGIVPGALWISGSVCLVGLRADR